MWARAIVIVGVDHMIVHVHAGEHRTSAGAAHGSRGVGMSEFSTSVSYQPQKSWHEVETPCQQNEVNKSFKQNELFFNLERIFKTGNYIIQIIKS